MFGWLRELLEIRHDFRERRYKLLTDSNRSICDSCENLKIALERANYEKDLLLKRIMDPPKIEEPVQKFNPDNRIPPRFVPWRVQQQKLEAQDRILAEQLKKNAPQPIEELEKELEDAGSTDTKSIQ